MTRAKRRLLQLGRTFQFGIINIFITSAIFTSGLLSTSKLQAQDTAPVHHIVSVNDSAAHTDTVSTKLESSEPLSLSPQDPTSHVLSIIQIILGLIAAFVALGAIVIAWFGRTTHRTVLETKNKCDDLEKRFEKEVTKVKEMLDATTHNIILSADLALMNLPDITFTQQIPMNLLQDLQILENTFSGRAGAELWKKIGEMENGARIRYARGLYHLGLNPMRVSRTIPVSYPDRDVKPASVLDFLEEAYKMAGEDNRLKRNVLIRLCQAYRQIPDFHRARRILGELESLDKNGADPLARIVAQWGDAVVDLQQGLGAEGQEKERYRSFAAANMKMKKVFRQVFGWPLEKGQGDPRFYQARKSASIAYYTAKAMWSLRYTYPSNVGDFYSKFKEDKPDEFISRLEYALDLSTKLLWERIMEGIECPLTLAIYSSSLAFVLIVRSSPIVPSDFPSNKGLFKEQDGDEKHWQNLLEEYLRMAKAQRVTLDKMSIETGLPSTIYCEGTERLDTLSEFASDLALLDAAKTDSEALFRFYRTGERPM